MKRVTQRGRACESDIPAQFIDDIAKQYKKVFGDEGTMFEGTELLRINTEKLKVQEVLDIVAAHVKSRIGER